MTARVLALDLATVTGWAFHEPGMERPFMGAFRLPGDTGEVGRRADALERWLRDQFKMFEPTHFFFEAQHVAADLDINTVYMLIALGGTVEKFAYQVNSETYRVMISQWRQHFIGRGSGFKRIPGTKRYQPGEDPKQLALDKCSRLGWHTKSTDAAEAAGILDYALTLIPQYPRPWRDADFLKRK